MNLTVTIFMLCLYKGAVCADSFVFIIHKNISQHVTGPSCSNGKVIEFYEHGIRIFCLHIYPPMFHDNIFINGVIERRCNGFKSCNITEDSRFIYEQAMKEDNNCVGFKVEVFYVCKDIKELSNMCNLSTMHLDYNQNKIYSPGYPDTITNQQQLCTCVIEPPSKVLIVTIYLEMQFLLDNQNNSDSLTLTWANNTSITFKDEKLQDNVYGGILKGISLTTNLFPQHLPHGKVFLKLIKQRDNGFQIHCSNTVGPSETTYSLVSTSNSPGSETKQDTSTVSTTKSVSVPANGDQVKVTSRPLIIGVTVGVVLLLGLLIAVSVLIYTNRGRIANYRKTRAKGQQSTPENHQYYNVGVNNVTSSQNQSEYENVDLFGLQQSQVSNIPALLSDPIYTINDPTTLPQHASIYASLDNTTTYSAAVNKDNQINNPELEAIREYSGLNSGTRHEQLRPNEYEQLDGNHADIVSNRMHHSQQENSQYAHGNLTNGHGIYYNN